MLLIVEDDPSYARILLDMAHEKGFKGIVAQARRRRRWPWRATSNRMPSPWTCTCPTSMAGGCWTA